MTKDQHAKYWVESAEYDRNAAIELVKNFAKDIETHSIKLKAVFMFGSYVNGTQNECSDIDVALVSDDFAGSPEDHNLFPYMGGIHKEYTRIETATYPSEYFDKGDPFINHIQKTGLRIA